MIVCRLLALAIVIGGIVGPAIILSATQEALSTESEIASLYLAVGGTFWVLVGLYVNKMISEHGQKDLSSY